MNLSWTTVAELAMLGGGLVALFAGIGLLRFSTVYARIHSAGKASPVALLLTALGAGPLLGWGGAAYLAIAAGAMVLTLPFGVHLLFRAHHRTDPDHELIVDEKRRPNPDELTRDLRRPPAPPER